MTARALLAAAALLFAASAASAQYVYLGPYSGGTRAWRFGTWDPAIPEMGGGTTVTINFPNPNGWVLGGNYTSLTDRGSFVFNNLTFTSAGGQIGLGSDSTFGTETNRLVAGGVNPTIVQNGLGTAFFQQSQTSINPDVNQFGGVTVTGTGFGRVVFDGMISGSGGLTINFPQPNPTSGRVVFQSTTFANNFTGALNLNGNLVLATPLSPLGNAANPLVVNGGTIGIDGRSGISPPPNVTVPNPVTLNANLVVALSCQPNAAPTLTFTNTIADGPAAPRGVDVRSLNGNTAFGAGTLVLQGSNTYSGNTTVAFTPHYESAEPAVGTMVFSGVAGSALSSPRFTVADGGLLVLDSRPAGNHAANNRIADTARVSLAGSQFVIAGAAGAATTETVGALDVAGGSVVTVDAAAAGNSGTSVQFASLTRVGRGAVLFRGNNPGFGGTAGPGVGNVTFAAPPTAQLVGGNAPGTPNVSILPYAFGAVTLANPASTGTDLVTYGTNGIRPLAPAEYATSLPTGTTQQNVKLTTTSAFTGAGTINSLVLAPGASLSTANGTVTVTSGTVLPAATVTVGANLGIAFGAAEGHVIVTNSPTATLIMNGVLSGTGGLTKSGIGVLRLVNTGNTISGAGGLTLNEGTVEFHSPAGLGGLPSITVNGRAAVPPGLRYIGAGPATLALPVTVEGGFGRFGSDGTSSPLTVSGAIQGSGGVMIDTAGEVRLTGNNTYSGTTRVQAGRLVISSDANLGPNSPAVVLVTNTTPTSAGRLMLQGAWTTSKTLRIADSPVSNDFAVVDTNGFDATLNGPLVGAGLFHKVGAGRLTLTQPTDFGQGNATTKILVAGGELRVTSTGVPATGLATVDVQSGATLSGHGRIAAAVNGLAGSIIAPGNGAVGTLRVDSDVTVSGRFAVEVSGATSDRLSLYGRLTVGSASVLEVTGALDPATTYTIADYGSVSSNPVFSSVIGLPSTHQLVIGPTTMQIAPVPEPTGVLAAALTALAAGRVLRRRPRSDHPTRSAPFPQSSN